MEICLIKIWIVLLTIGHGFTYEPVNNFDFNKDHLGVYYRPYVMKAEAGSPAPSAGSYTFEMVQTQLAIISTKFSKIYTQSVANFDVPYERNFTYYHQSNVDARIAEAAALLNRKMNKTLLTVTMGIYDTYFNDSRVMRTEVDVALEAIQIANSIHPGTVKEIVLTNFDVSSLDWANSAIYWIDVLRQRTLNMSLKIGTIQYCEGMSSVEPHYVAQKEMWLARKALIQQSDFIICSFKAADRIAKHGALYSVGDLQYSILLYRSALQKINSHIEVMLTTEWKSDGDESWENLKEFGNYWIGMNELATENNFTVWMKNAFDTPSLDNLPFGWWKLTKNALVNNVTGYVEKVSEREPGNVRESENNFDFNKKYFGVYYWPYVKKAEAGMPVPSESTYTFEMVQTQLAIISTKFSRIYTQRMDSFDVPYERNFTYYHQSYVVARTAEAAAHQNRKMNKTLLTVTLGIWNSAFIDSQDTQTEVSVALEAAEIANSIHPGTVKALVLTRDVTTSLHWANSALHWMNMLRNKTINMGLKIGTRQYCTGLSFHEPDDPIEKEIWLVLKAIIQKSDFIICNFIPTATNAKHGAKFSIGELRHTILGYRPILQKINPQIEVMWGTSWESDAENSFGNWNDFGDYWSEMNKLASENNIPVYMNGAFDSPLIYNYPFGWWRLTRNALANNATGYVEKVSGMPVNFSTETKLSNFTETEVDAAVSSSTQYPETTEKVRAPGRIETTATSANLASMLPYLNIEDGQRRNEEEKTNKNWHIEKILIIILTIALLSVLIYLIWSKYRKRTGYTILAKRDIDEFKYGLLDADMTQEAYNYSNVNTCALKRPYDRGLEISKSKLEILHNQVLGGGQFGCVYKAILKNGMEREVAVKMTRHDCLDTAVKGILSEIKILSYLGNHPNIVSIVGAYTADIGSGIVYLVLELCSSGSLRNYLRNFRSEDKATKNEFTNEIPLSNMIRWSHEIACGMQYLEEKNVIHADLATRNVLLTSDLIAKITDFGLARRLHEYSVYTKHQQEPLPWRWMAIESLKKTEFSIKSDVWSYGVTLWEIFSFGALPFPGRSWNDDFIEELEHESLRLSRPTYATDEMYNIMLTCWKLLPEDRPRFVELRAETKLIYEATEKHEANAAQIPSKGDFLVSLD